MRIAVLGPLEVLRDDSSPVPVPGEQQRLLLAALVSAAPDAVPTDRLVEILASGDDVLSARESLHDHLRGLRRALEPGLPERSSGQYVLRRGQGFGLAVARSDIDAVHAADLVARGRSRLAEGDAAEAVRLLTTALALWRGQPYADWPAVAFAEAERHRLAELRASAEATLQEARARPVPQLAGPPTLLLAPARPLPAYVPATTPPDRGVALAQSPGIPVLPPASQEPAGDEIPDGPPPAPDRIAADGSPPAPVGRWIAGLAAAVAAVLLAAGLSARSSQEDEPAGVVAEAEALATRSMEEKPLDLSLLLAAQAFRLADTAHTREALRSALLEHDRVERVVDFSGVPQDPVLSGGGRTLSFGIGNYVVAWQVGPRTQPGILMGIPTDWVSWVVAAGSPTDQVVLGAGGAEGAPWIRAVSAVDGTSHLLADSDRIEGRPIDGAVTPDGREFLVLVARADPVEPGAATQWELMYVDVADGTRRDTPIAGRVPVPLTQLRTDFADDAGSFVLWDSAGAADATLVDVAAARQTPIAASRGPVASAGFRALPTGLAQLWFDGMVTLLDRDGAMVQWLDFHTARVRDVVLSPDGTWGATAGDGSEIVRWDVDPANGRWSRPQELDGHVAGVVGLELHGDGQQLFSVSLDGTAMLWDMRAHGGLEAERGGRPDDTPAVVWLRDACAVVARDLSPAEWRRYLPYRPYQATCTDLL